MDADIRILSTDLTEALQSYIERRLHFSLGRFGRRMGRARVRITDVNGSRGGANKSCQISAELHSTGKALLQQAVDANLYAAIGRARVLRCSHPAISDNRFGYFNTASFYLARSSL
jgi:putative sigma-54 modulation protein